MDERQRAVCAAVDALAGEMVETLQAFIRVPTVNPPGEAYEDFVALAKGLLDRLGYATEVVRVPDELLPALAPLGEGLPRPSLLARLSGPAGPGFRLHINGHYDVVPAGHDWTRDPFGGELVDGRIYGRGACDMKSGLVAQVYAVEALRRAGVDWAGEVTHSFVPDEETVGNRNAGTGFLVEQELISRDNTDGVIITEPFGLDGIGVGHKGALWGAFTLYGKQAHGSAPHLGVNAVELAARFLCRAESELKPQLRQRRTELLLATPGTETATLSFDTIEGGVATNVIPDRCTVTFNRRLVPPETLDQARQELFDLLEALRVEEPRARWSYEERYATPPTLVDEQEPLAQAAAQAIRAMGMTPRVMISAGSHDQRFVVHGAGITNSILYGPATNGTSHQSDEYITVDELVTGTKVLALILLDVLRPARASG